MNSGARIKTKLVKDKSMIPDELGGEGTNERKGRKIENHSLISQKELDLQILDIYLPTY